VAFVLQQSWHGVEEVACGPPLAESPLLRPLLAHGRGRYWRRGGGTVLTAAVHAVLLWAIATRLVGPIGGDPLPTSPPQVLQFDLSAPAPSTRPAEALARARQAAQPVVAESELDVTTPTDIPPPEWTVSRIALPVPEPLGQGASMASGGGGAGAGAGGSGVYDPFAGAAPLPLDRGAAGASAALDAALLDALRRGVERALTSCGGTVLLAVRVGPGGIVMDASVRGGSAPPAAKAMMRSALLGKQLFRGGAQPGDRQLPEIAFCA
jgi:hypothetical protein